MRAFRVVYVCASVWPLFLGADAWSQNGARRLRQPPATAVSSRFFKVLTVGQLRPNPAARHGEPPYVLIRRDGSQRCLVTPGPGIDLSRFVGSRIGIRGRGSNLATTGKLHVRADRVTPLQTNPMTKTAWVAAGPVEVAESAGNGDGVPRRPADEMPPPGRHERRRPEAAVAPGPVRPVGAASAQPDKPEEIPEPNTLAPDTLAPDTLAPDTLDGAPDPAGVPDPTPSPAVSDHVELVDPGVPAELALPPLESRPAQCGPACHPSPGGGTSCCGDYHQRCGPACPCGSDWKYWVRGEYLLWWTDSMNVPPLVTTSPPGTDAVDAGVLEADGTTVLFGNEPLFDGARDGGRILVGTWLGEGDCLGLEGEYFGLESKSIGFRAASDDAGRPILARPYFNVNPREGGTGPLDPPARQDSELVAFRGELAGVVTVNASTQLDSAGVRLRWNYHCCDLGQQNPCSPRCGTIHRVRLDFLLGYRYLQLEEGLSIREDLTSLNQENLGQFQLLDQFDTRNQFNGVEIGTQWEMEHQAWFVELLAKLALGNNRQVVRIHGATVSSPAGAPSTVAEGGLLAQRTNIGQHVSNDLAVVPELGVTAGYRLTERLRATVGYTFLYWSRVVRPGEIIDLDVNPDLLPQPTEPLVGAPRPAFAFRDTDFWAQGLRLGLDFRW